ncbi:hypothetical protein TNCV_1181401 [Trichonephila clavipes]|nr:hypothetical protein TNCV_1181401 [Trichonephila clavipes]
MGELENTHLLPPKFLVERGYENRPAFRAGIFRVNGYKADSFRHIAGNFRPCKWGLSVLLLCIRLIYLIDLTDR